MDYILAATFHAQPEHGEAWALEFEAALPNLKKLYRDIYISATESSSRSLTASGQPITDYFNSRGVICCTLQKQLGDNHRSVLAMALDHIESENYRIHYCDLDRIFVWSINYFEELKTTLMTSESLDVLFPCRQGIWSSEPETEPSGQKIVSAWESHPITQKATEIYINHAVNQAISLVTEGQLGNVCKTDPPGTSQITSPSYTRYLLDGSEYVGFPHAEWLAIIVSRFVSRNYIDRIKCLDVNGLRFETLEIYKYIEATQQDFNGFYGARFHEIEASSGEAIKRVDIAVSMLEGFLKSINTVDKLNGTRRIISDNISTLLDMKKDVQLYPDDTKSILENHYLRFINQNLQS
jgi:hypothetical protein